MRLWAISDLHLGYRVNREALEALPARPGDWLILGGDVGETPAHLAWALERVCERFDRVLWVPGNHDLWTHPKDPCQERGEARYQLLVALCRHYGVLTPEDPYPVWPGSGPGERCILAPLFLLYDYSFGPDDCTPAQAVAWAMEAETLCTDEALLHPDPHPSREAWCEARLAQTEPRLAEAAARAPLVLINHFPLRRELVRLRRIPRFVVWCGTRRTEDWHLRYNARVVVSGHLHVRATDWKDGVRFEEVSLGYPPHWRRERGAEGYLREILPGPQCPAGGHAPTRWHR